MLPIERKIGGIALIFFGILLLIKMIIIVFTPFTSINPNTLSTVSGHLREEPHVAKPAKSTSHNITFHLQEFSHISFETGSLGYKMINLDSLAIYRRGDKVTFLITKNDLEKKILQTSEPTFNEKHISWPFVQVYSIESDKRSILSFKRYNDQLLKLKSNNSIWGWVAIGVTIFIIVIGFKEYSKKRRVD